MDREQLLFAARVSACLNSNYKLIKSIFIIFLFNRVLRIRIRLSVETYFRREHNVNVVDIDVQSNYAARDVTIIFYNNIVFK